MSENFKDRILRARENEEECLRIIRDFEPLIKKYIKLYVKDPVRYEDAMQEGRLTMLKCIKQYDLSAPAPFEAYVKMAVIYNIKNFAAKHREHVSLDEDLTETGGNLHDLLDSGVDLEGEEIKREDLRALRDALDKLTEGEREVIDEFYFQKKSIREMCKGRRCHYMTVVKRKERALGRLREGMGG